LISKIGVLDFTCINNTFIIYVYYIDLKDTKRTTRFTIIATVSPAVLLRSSRPCQEILEIFQLDFDRRRENGR